MSRIISINIFLFLILFSCITAQSTLRFTLRQNNREAIVLNWEKTEQFLANEHLPVWFARPGEDGNPGDVVVAPEYISRNIGEFVFYHDPRKSSAVVYFKRQNVIFGNIGEKYTINGLPFRELQREHNLRGSRYVVRQDQSNSQNIANYQRQLAGTGDESLLLFPEILVLITNDMLSIVQELSSMNPLSLLIAKYLVFFNTISMLFDQLSSGVERIHINIAGIILEDHFDGFPFIIAPPSEEGDCKINAQKSLLQDVPKYLRNAGFSDDSFDFFFISTRCQLYTPLLESGFLTPQFHMYEMRSSPSYSEHPKFLGLIDYFNTNYVDSIVAARKIAWLMNINTQKQALSIGWTLKNIRDLSSYARENRNHCFLLNHPRSLLPFDLPSETLAPWNQCICYRHAAVSMEYVMVGETGCNQKLKCKHQTFPTDVRRTPLPIDGTPCDIDKVCWKKQCRKREL